MMDSGQDLVVPTGEKSWREIRLTDVEIRSVNHQMATQKTEIFAITGQAIMILIPRTEANNLRNYVYWDLFKIPRAGLYHLGPYLIFGKMMFSHPDSKDDTMVMSDVTITHSLPNLGVPEIQAPFILINTRWLSGYIPME